MTTQTATKSQCNSPTPLPEYETIRVDATGGIITIELNRPDKLNAISLTMAEEIADATVRTAYHPDARVLVLRGAGKSFSAGYDIGNGQTGDHRHRWLQSETFRSASAQLEQAPVVRIAELQGHCVGAGLMLSTVCHLRYASPDARFSVPEIKLGIPFSMGGVPGLMRLIGITRTTDMVLNCTPYDAATAKEIGLVTDVLAGTALRRTVDEVAATLAARPALLMLQSITSLREAANGLLRTDANDLSAMMLAQSDPESIAASAGYANRFRGTR